MKMNFRFEISWWCLICCLSWCYATVAGIIGEYPELQARTCFSKHAQTLNITCHQHHMLHMMRVIYGHSTDEMYCKREHDKCEMTLTQPQSYSCVGWQTCQINLPSGGRGRYLPRCGQHSSYMQVHYECIPVRDMVEICTTEAVRQQRGYIITPGYPHNYPNSMQCKLNIQLPTSAHNTAVRQKIKLYIIDLNLEANHTDCPDWLNTFDGFRSNTICGRRARQNVLTTMESHLVLSLHTNGENQQKGFWLYFEAIPYIATDEDDSNTATPPVVNSSNQTRQTNPLTAEQIHNTCIRKSPLFVGVIVALITTTILCVILAFTSVTLIKRRHDGHRRLPSVSASTSEESSSTEEMKSKTGAGRNVWYINNDIIPLQCSYIDRDTNTGEEQLIC